MMRLRCLLRRHGETVTVIDRIANVKFWEDDRGLHWEGTAEKTHLQCRLCGRTVKEETVIVLPIP